MWQPTDLLACLLVYALCSLTFDWKFHTNKLTHTHMCRTHATKPLSIIVNTLQCTQLCMATVQPHSKLTHTYTHEHILTKLEHTHRINKINNERNEYSIGRSAYKNILYEWSAIHCSIASRWIQVKIILKREIIYIHESKSTLIVVPTKQLNWPKIDFFVSYKWNLK